MTARRRGLLAFLLLCGCGDGAPYVQISLESGQPLQLAALEVTVQLGNDTGKAIYAPPNGIALPPSQTLALKLGPSRQGQATVELRAMAGGNEVARARGQVELVPKGVARLTLQLLPAISDLGSDLGGDLGGDFASGEAAQPVDQQPAGDVAMADHSPPMDLSAAVDAAPRPDLTEAPDLVAPSDLALPPPDLAPPPPDLAGDAM